MYPFYKITTENQTRDTCLEGIPIMDTFFEGKTEVCLYPFLVSLLSTGYSQGMYPKPKEGFEGKREACAA